MIKKISDNELIILNNHKYKALLHNNSLCYLTDFEIIEKKNLFGKTIKYLNKYTIEFFHSFEKEIYQSSDIDALNWLPIYDIQECRENWLSVKESVCGFGFQIISEHES